VFLKSNPLISVIDSGLIHPFFAKLNSSSIIITPLQVIHLQHKLKAMGNASTKQLIRQKAAQNFRTNPAP